MGKKFILALMLSLTMCYAWNMDAAQSAETASAETAPEVTEDNATEVAPDTSKDSKASSEQESATEEDATTEDAATETQPSDSKAEQSKDEQSTEDQSTEESSETQNETVEEPSVEQERPVEVEPPQEEKKPPKKENDRPKKKKYVIGATAVVMEKQSEILFSARVDSGAKSCSLHVEQIKIDNEVEGWEGNIGKVIHFQITNGKGKKHWLKSKIANYVLIKTSNSRERRYKVPLTFQWKDMEKKVLVTLNNRKSMEFPLLIGRNFLRGDFLVDVEIDSND